MSLAATLNTGWFWLGPFVLLYILSTLMAYVVLCMDALPPFVVSFMASIMHFCAFTDACKTAFLYTYT